MRSWRRAQERLRTMLAGLFEDRILCAMGGIQGDINAAHAYYELWQSSCLLCGDGRKSSFHTAIGTWSAERIGESITAFPAMTGCLRWALTKV